MSTPTILGFPLWYGHISRRVAKKYLNDWGLACNSPWGRSMSKLTIGDYVNDCSHQNGKILKLAPRYTSVGTKGRGHILTNVYIHTDTTGSCSLLHCGIEPALPRDVVEARMKEGILEWVFSDQAKNWFGNDYEWYISLGKKKLATLNAGGHICNELGQLLPEYKKRDHTEA